MQSKNNICKDARTFGEIWESLSKTEKNELFAELVTNGVTYNKITVWFWASGKRRPARRTNREAIVNAVSKITGCEHNFKTLFPIPEDY